MTDNTQPEAAFPILVVEIGTEEIPARFLPDAIERIKEYSGKLFSEYRVCFGAIKSYATPRRLSLVAEIDSSQTASEKEVWGPPANVAFDKEGKPAKAAEAFAKSLGIATSDLAVKEKGKGSYVVATIKETSNETCDILPELLSKLIDSLHFPKAMRWGNGDFRFVRPIHWIFATFDNKKIQLEIEGIKSGNITRGHRFLSPASFEIKDSKTYINLLRNNFVILDPAERKKTISEASAKLATSVNAFVVEDEALLNHVSFLTEYPVPVLGTFPPEYLDLPGELLITVMKDHQKYFALEDNRGQLTNHFIVVSNTRQENASMVKKGAEKVIKARFEDARFYYEDDKKIPLMDRLEGLKKVTFHDRLGTLHAKVKRITDLALFIAEKCCGDKKEEVKTAAMLSKADLISGVVREFPELQGVMGSYYAVTSGHKKEIATAIKEQYLPKFSGDKLPESTTGAIVSLADKIDNIASFFMLGLVPTGTEDPFALRRQTIGAILILIDQKYDVTVGEMLKAALKPYEKIKKEEIIVNIIKFFEQRFDPIFSGAGYSSDVISAVTGLVKDMPLFLIKDRMDALTKLKQEADYDNFLLMIKRINNIAPKMDMPKVKKTLLMQDEEKALYSAVEAAAPGIESAIAQSRLTEAISTLMSLKDPVNLFFDKVLIMDKNEEIKQNRLALIKSIQALGFKIADFSKLA